MTPMSRNNQLCYISKLAGDVLIVTLLYNYVQFSSSQLASQSENNRCYYT